MSKRGRFTNHKWIRSNQASEKKMEIELLSMGPDIPKENKGNQRLEAQELNG